MALEVSSSGPMGGYTSATFEYAEPPVPVALRPASGPAEGGGVLFLSLAGAEAWTAGSSLGGAAAQFGTVWPLAARARAGGAETAAPARAPGVALVSLATDASAAAAAVNGLRFATHSAPPEVVAAHPTSPLTLGGVGRRHRGQRRATEDEDVPAFCQFGLELVPRDVRRLGEACAPEARAYLPATEDVPRARTRPPTVRARRRAD